MVLEKLPDLDQRFAPVCSGLIVARRDGNQRKITGLRVPVPLDAHLVTVVEAEALPVPTNSLLFGHDVKKFLGSAIAQLILRQNGHLVLGRVHHAIHHGLNVIVVEKVEVVGIDSHCEVDRAVFTAQVELFRVY